MSESEWYNEDKARDACRHASKVINEGTGQDVHVVDLIIQLRGANDLITELKVEITKLIEREI